MRITNENGFTFLEVVTVVFVVGIMAAIATPIFLSWKPNMQLKAASRDLYSNMQHVRISAVKTNSDSAVVFDTTNNRYYLCDDWGADGSWSGANDATGTGDNNIVQTIDLNNYRNGVGYGHATIPAGNSATNPAGAFPGDDVSYSGPVNVLTFNSRGICNGGYVYLQNQKNTVYAVGTQTSGVIMLKKWSGGGWQ